MFGAADAPGGGAAGDGTAATPSEAVNTRAGETRRIRESRKRLIIPAAAAAVRLSRPRTRPAWPAGPARRPSAPTPDPGSAVPPPAAQVPAPTAARGRAAHRAPAPRRP